jgi:hypothetical protein
MNVPSDLLESVPFVVLRRLNETQRALLEAALELAYLQGRLSLSGDILEESPHIKIHDDFGPVRCFGVPAYSDK